MGDTTSSRADWGSPSDLPLDRIWNARRQAHYALQVAAALHVSRYTARDDQSHTAFVVDRGAFVSLGDPDVPWRAALRPDTLEVELRGRDGEVAGRLPLAGIGLEQAYVRFAAMLHEVAGPGKLVRLNAELPPHPVAGGAPFEPDEPALRALRELFADAASLLAELRPDLTSPSPARLWPHHFDLAVLDDLDAAADPGGDVALDPERRRSVGIGMTPGDDGVREPYLYVTPWPYPAASRLPPLPEGAWTTDGWVGAVLQIRMLADDAPERRRARARAFVDAAIRGSRRMLSAEPERESDVRENDERVGGS